LSLSKTFRKFLKQF